MAVCLLPLAVIPEEEGEAILVSSSRASTVKASSPAEGGIEGAAEVEEEAGSCLYASNSVASFYEYT